MKPFINFICWMFIVLFWQAAEGCAGGQSSTASAKAIAVTKNSPTGINDKTPALRDEDLFKGVLKKFKSAIKSKNKVAISAFIHFPLQTLPQWTNDELQSSTFTPQQGLINSKEFLVYFDDIFTADATRLIPVSQEDDLSEIDKTTTENYYKTLQKVTDKGSTLYELQKNYTEDNGKETSFGFVFGKVKGTYKVISYYRSWPIK
jgi:hypothetical protein